MSKKTFEDRIKGCLIGSTIGAELGFARYVRPEKFKVEQPMDILKLKLEPAFDYQEEKNRVMFRRATPFIDLGIQAYLAKGGRVTPEDFGSMLKDDEQLAGPVFGWDGIHTSQEILREGMHPRLSGLGVARNGNICAAMPAVGIYHFADPEYAYLDAVELASVCQPREGADWAGLCAAGIAAALDSDATAESVSETVLKMAFGLDKDLFYRMNVAVRAKPARIKLNLS